MSRRQITDWVWRRFRGRLVHVWRSAAFVVVLPDRHYALLGRDVISFEDDGRGLTFRGSGNVGQMGLYDIMDPLLAERTVSLDAPYWNTGSKQPINDVRISHYEGSHHWLYRSAGGECGIKHAITNAGIPVVPPRNLKPCAAKFSIPVECRAFCRAQGRKTGQTIYEFVYE